MLGGEAVCSEEVKRLLTYIGRRTIFGHADKPSSPDTLDESIELFKAVADPVRLRLLNLLAAARSASVICTKRWRCRNRRYHDTWRISENGAGGRPQGRAMGALPPGKSCG